MLAIVNFVAVFVVSAVVAYQIYETINKYKDISKKLTDLAEEDASTRYAMKKSLDATSSNFNEKVNATEQQFNKQLENTQTYMTTEFQNSKEAQDATKIDLKKTEEKVNTLDTFFKSLSQQVVTKNTTTETLNLGKKFMLSGVGDTKFNDDWLRLMSGDGKDYYGGFATNKLWVGGATILNDDLQVENGKVNFRKTPPGPMIEKNMGKNEDRYGVGQFANGSMRMYTSSSFKPATAGLSIAKSDGTLDDVLAVTTDKLTNIYGDVDLRGKLFLGRVDGSTDPYTVEKKVYAPDQSALRLTINNNSDEALEIWGDSCAAGNCAGEGLMRHKFQANGDARHDGSLEVKKRLLVSRTKRDKYPAWGDGIHTWDLYANGSIGVGTDGNVAASMNSAGKVQGKEVCIDNVCLNSAELSAIKSQAKV